MSAAIAAAPQVIGKPETPTDADKKNFAMGRGKTALVGSLLQEDPQVPALSTAGPGEISEGPLQDWHPEQPPVGLVMVWDRIQLCGVLGCLWMQRENSAFCLVVKALLLEPSFPLCVPWGGINP